MFGLLLERLLVDLQLLGHLGPRLAGQNVLEFYVELLLLLNEQLLLYDLQKYSDNPDQVRNRDAIKLGKLACPLVNDDQKIDVGDQKCISGRPQDYWTLENLFSKI